MNKLTEKELAQEISRSINNMSFDYTQFIAEMAKDHRTLQQKFTVLCLHWIHDLAQRDNNFDLRNEASVKMAKKIESNLLEQDNDFYWNLPCI